MIRKWVDQLRDFVLVATLIALALLCILVGRLTSAVWDSTDTAKDNRIASCDNFKIAHPDLPISAKCKEVEP